MQPDDLSLPRADNKIKEKLNLHVKKRLLQDPAKCTPASSSKIPPQSISCPVVVAPSAVAPPPTAPTPKTKKQKTKHSAATAATNSSAASDQTVQLTIGTLGSLSSRPVAAENLLLSPGGTGGNSNDSSFNSVEADPDASNDGQAGTSNGEKGGGKASSSKPDIFTLILNEKKASLMRDPEVIKFLNDIMKERNKN